MTAGLILGADAASARGVTVTGAGTLGATDGVQLNGGATFASGTVTMPDSSHADISQASGATGTVLNAHLTGPIGLTTADVGHPSLAARDVTISSAQNAIAVPATGAITVDEALIVMHGPSPKGLSVANGTLDVDGATIVAADERGVGASIVASANEDASLTLQDTIIRGFDTAVARAATPGSNADLTARYDDLRHRQRRQRLDPRHGDARPQPRRRPAGSSTPTTATTTCSRTPRSSTRADRATRCA